MKINKVIHFNTAFTKSSSDDEKNVTIRGMASTGDKDRAGDVISPNAWKGGLDSFEKNPIILFNHNYDRPVGRATYFKSTKNGLELEANINKKVAPDVAEAVSEGLLNAFSVGCLIKEADYDNKTEIFVIKEAELLEVSVVSVPCNQNATFQVAKCFDSAEDFEEFKKTFTGQTSANADAKVSNKDSISPEKLVENDENKDKKMDKEELEALAKRVAEDTAAKIAMQRAEEETAKEAKAKADAEEKALADAKKAEEEETISSTIRTGIESGVDKLKADMEKTAETAKGGVAEALEMYKAEIENMKAELKAMNDQKMKFKQPALSLKQFQKEYETEILQAHILGLATHKGWDTGFAKDLLQKAGEEGGSWGEAAGTIFGTTISTAIEKEIQYELTVAPLFREIPVSSRTTILPWTGDTTAAQWQNGSITHPGNVENVAPRPGDAGSYSLQEITLTAYRLISQTYLDNDVEETGIIAMLPILTQQVARAHALAVDGALVNGVTGAQTEGAGTGNITGLVGHAADVAQADRVANGVSEQLLGLRKNMGKYGLKPRDVTYIVSPATYYELIDDDGFSDVDMVGSDMAAKRTGVMGSVYGSRIVVSDQLSDTETQGDTWALAVYTPNYVVPRLRGVTLETDYEVGNQRQVIVGYQSLGFNELIQTHNQGEPVVGIEYPA